MARFQTGVFLMCVLAGAFAPKADAIFLGVLGALTRRGTTTTTGSSKPAVAAAATPTGALFPRLFGGGLFGAAAPPAKPGRKARPGSGGGLGACSGGASASAVERCVNAVRTNPAAFAGAVPCGISLSPRSPLRTDSRLTSAARRHASDMAARGFVGHTGTDGSSLGTRVRGAGFSGGAIAENAAGGQRSARDVVFDWLCSPGHAANLLSCRYDSFGTGVVGASWVQNFGCSSGACGC